MFVRSVRTRGGRVVVSADQLRVVARVKSAFAVRLRLSAAFAGYLV